MGLRCFIKITENFFKIFLKAKILKQKWRETENCRIRAKLIPAVWPTRHFLNLKNGIFPCFWTQFFEVFSESLVKLNFDWKFWQNWFFDVKSRGTKVFDRLTDKKPSILNRWRPNIAKIWSKAAFSKSFVKFFLCGTE